MKRADSLGVLPQEQHGWRSRNTPIEVVALISPFFDYVKQKRRYYVPVPHDAENCYDFVANNFASLTDRAFNMPFP